MSDTLTEIKTLGENVTKVLAKSEAASEQAQKAEKSITEIKGEVTTIGSNIKVLTEWKAEREQADAKNQEALNSLIAETKANRDGSKPGEKGQFFGDVLSKAIEENYNEIKTVRKGHSVPLNFKAGANMSTATDLVGQPNITYIPKPALIPRQKVNFRDLVPTFQSQTGLISLFRETPPIGAPAIAAEGTVKPQLEYQYKNVQFTAEYISGFVRVPKQMLQDLLFLQTYLPQQLLRDFYKAENSIFYSALTTAATAPNTSTGGNDAEIFIDLMTNVEQLDFGVNGYVVPPAVWGTLMKTTVPTNGTSYSVPGGFSINPLTGQIEIAGVPIVKATFATAGSAVVGDWTMASIASVDNLKVEFFEEDSDNVQRNLVTVRVEAREVLVIERPDAFAYKTGL